ncbi:MAG: glycosyltransferase, partial [Tepidisphaeraceae bacterium]
MRIMLIGHACGPGLGSEPGTTWNLAWQLARRHDVWVLAHPKYRDKTDKYLTAYPNPNLHMVYVTLPSRLDPWDPEKGERGLKLHYLVWQHIAARKARELCNSMTFDVAHHVSLGTINAPPVLHKLPVPVVWGPIGGGQTAPMAFKDYFKGAVVQEKMRRAMCAMLPFTPSLRRMARKASLSLAKNFETLELLRRAGAREAQFMLDCGLPPDYASDATGRRDVGGEFRLLWGGRCELRKTLPLGLEALAKVKARVRLTVAGDGPMKSQWESIARELGVSDRVEFLGNVPYQKMNELFRASHALLFTS